MARTSSRNENHRPRRRLLMYGLGFVLLTNVLTVLFVFLLRGPRHTSIAVVPAATAPVAEATPARAAPARAAPARAAKPPADTSRRVLVTSRPSGAVVRYRGEVQGTTPVTITLAASAAGVLTLEKDGYRARSVTVDPSATRVRVRLYHVPAPGAETTPTGARPARAVDTPARSPAPSAAPDTTAPAGAPAPGATVPAAAANETRPPVARPAQARSGRPLGSESPDPRGDARRPVAGARENLAPRAE